MSGLVRQSIDILLKHQHPEGAYVACPNFGMYQYAWLRDGSFCAYALERAGETGSADRFHDWVLRVLDTYQPKLMRCIAETARGKRPPDDECLHSRFTLVGLEVPSHWGHHQLDGLGTWMWVYCNRQSRLGQTISSHDRVLLELARDYLIALWPFPCSDCWEENEDRIHPHSLAAVYAGLTALGGLLNDPTAYAAAANVRAFILDKGVANGQLTKSIGIGEVDASLLCLATPYRVLELDDPIFQATYARILADLVDVQGGVHRYRADTYYGGGAWLLLSAWLGWVAVAMGDLTLARRQLAWVEQQANPAGELPEQVAQHLYAPEYLPVWIKRWGESASPLLWSHAQYLILHQALEANHAGF